MFNSVTRDIGSRCLCVSSLPCFMLLSLFDSPLCTLYPVSHFFSIHLIFIFIFHVGWFDEKSHVHFREWGVRHFGREQSSHRLWAQLQLPDLRDHWNLHLGVLQRQQALELTWLGDQWLNHRGALSSPLFTQDREEPASRRHVYHSPDESLSSQSSSVGHVGQGDLFPMSLDTNFKHQRKSMSRLRKRANQDSSGTARADSRWL